MNCLFLWQKQYELPFLLQKQYELPFLWQKQYELPFLASPVAQEVIVVTESLSH